MSLFNSGSMAGEMVLLGLAVYELSGSTAWVGLALALYYGPNFFVGAIAGTLADSFDRASVLRATEALIGVNLLAIGFLVWTGAGGLTVILVLTLVSGVLRSANNPARASYVFDLAGADRVVSALGTLNISMRLGQLGGALVAGWWASEYGIGAAYIVLSTSHVLAIAALGRQRASRPSPQAERPSVMAGLVEFARELRTNRALLALFATTTGVEVFGFSFLTALPDLAIGRLGLDAAGLGVLYAARSVGGVVAGIALTVAGPRRRLGVTWLVFVAGFGVMVMGLGLAPNLPLAVTAVAAIAFCAVASDVLTQSMMQLTVASDLRGRAMGAWQVAVGFSPIGQIQMGLLASALGTAAALMLNGAALVMVAIGAVATSRRLRQM